MLTPFLFVLFVTACSSDDSPNTTSPEAWDTQGDGTGRDDPDGDDPGGDDSGGDDSGGDSGGNGPPGELQLPPYDGFPEVGTEAWVQFSGGDYSSDKVWTDLSCMPETGWDPGMITVRMGQSETLEFHIFLNGDNGLDLGEREAIVLEELSEAANRFDFVYTAGDGASFQYTDRSGACVMDVTGMGSELDFFFVCYGIDSGSVQIDMAGQASCSMY